MKIKYPVKVGATVYPAQTSVRLATPEEIRLHWKSMAYNSESHQVAVLFPDRTVPIIVHEDQIES